MNLLRLSEKEIEERKASFRQMNLRDKIDYIYTYFRLPIVVALVLLYFVSYTV